MRRLLPRIGATLLARLLAALCSLALIWFMSHAWRPEEMADYAIVFSFLVLLQSLPLLGLNLPLARDVAAEPQAADRKASAVLAISIAAAGVLMVPFGAIGTVGYSGHLQVEFLVAALTLPVTALVCVFECRLIGAGRITFPAILNTAETVLRLLGFAGLTLLSACTLTNFLLVVLAGRLAVVLAYLPDSSIRAVLRTRPKRQDGLSYLRQAPWYVAGVGVAALAARLDVICLSGLVSREQLGIYAIAGRLYEMAMILPITAMTVVFPMFAREEARDPARFATVVQRTLWQAALLTIAVTAAATSIVEPVLTSTLPPPYAEASPSLRILLVAGAAIALCQVLASMLIVLRRAIHDLVSQVVGVIVLGIAAMLLVPHFGIEGAAVGVLTGAVAQLLVRFQFCRAHLAGRIRPAASGVAAAGSS